MYEQRPPYEGVVREYRERAYQLGEEFLNRYQSAREALDRGAHCYGVTASFTHPQFSNRLLPCSDIYIDTVYPAAVELASLSEEGVDREYFGWIDGSPVGLLQKENLEKEVEDAHALWFVSADVRDPHMQERAGYNHMMGILPSPNKDDFVVMDISGYVDPLARLSLDELYDQIISLPVGENYVQALISFKDRRLAREEPELPQEYRYFRPSNEAGRRFRRFPFFR